MTLECFVKKKKLKHLCKYGKGRDGKTLATIARDRTNQQPKSPRAR